MDATTILFETSKFPILIGEKSFLSL